MRKIVLSLPLFIFILTPLFTKQLHFGFQPQKMALHNVYEPELAHPWIDSVMATLTLDEKIAQLLMIRVQSDKDAAYYNNISSIIKKHKPGGICFFKGTPHKQAELTNRWQSESKTPMLIAIDGEWGLGMRLDSTISFPRQMTLGAIQNNRLIYEMGVEIARQMKRMGIHMNFAPVIDINSNPKNPVINTRSFGECKYNVSRKGIAYMRGMQDNGIIAVAKHFPGHGDTDTDSHYTLPVINHSQKRIDTLELFPFKQLINAGLYSIMIAHLNIPSYITDSNVASTLSDSVVTALLKNQLNFKGLVVTDALDMQGVSDYFKPGIIELAALKAGNDILLLPQDINKAINEIKKALLNGDIDEDVINERCRKILYFKQKVGLDRYAPVDMQNIYKDLNTKAAENLKRELVENAITIVKNDNDVLPLLNTNNLKIASLAIGDGKVKRFQVKLAENYDIKHYFTGKNFSVSDMEIWANRLKAYDRIIISIHNTNSLPQRNFGVTSQSINLIKRIKKEKNISLVVFGVPYILSHFDDTENMDAIIVAYQDDVYAQEASAKIIAGQMNASGKLSVGGNDNYPVNTGIITGKYKYLKYETPEALGISEKAIKKIDDIVIGGIKAGAYPGCQILFAKDGKVFYHKAFGHHTYDSLQPVRNTDVYDVASITKVAATTIALMKLVDDGLIDLQDRLEKHLPYLDGTNKGNIKIIDVLGHQARLRSWIPFYTKTLDKGVLKPDIYSENYSDEFNLKVADNIYMKASYYDTIIQTIIESPLNKNRNYLYSDLGFYFLREIIEKVSGKRVDDYMYETFYAPMGLNKTVYNPRKHFELDMIVPSEIDNYFRRQIIHGYVNDQGVAMCGGLGAHAGLFSNSWELAVIMQMLLNKGTLGEQRFINENTVTEFTRRHFTSNNNNRRGLGFDKPLINGGNGGPTCIGASGESYGHTGFTGTYVWVDPKYNLIYVFLSNRTYPDPENRKISRMNIRTDIHQIIYDELTK